MAGEQSNKLTALVRQNLRLNKYMAQTPTDKQAAALLFGDVRELFYGGAGRGGKSSFLLMAALQYVDVPGYSALILRRKFADLTKSKGLIDRSFEYLGGTDAQWNGQLHRWTFPSGATISFWGCEYTWSVFDHSGTEYQCICFDELTDFAFSQYEFLQTRLSRPLGMNVPLRLRSASNPPFEKQRDGDWVRDYFVEPAEGDEKAAKRLFIPAFLTDNPHTDADAFRESLSGVDPIIVERILNGDWTVRPAGMMFQRQWYEIVEALPEKIDRVVRAWDMAATKPRRGRPPDWTVGLLMGRAGNLYFTIDVVRMQGDPGETEALMKQTLALDRLKWGERYLVREEQEGGSSGKTVIHKRTQELAGYDYEGSAPRESKAARARPVAVQVKAGNIKLLKGAWNKPFLDESERFPFGTFDDQKDAESLAFSTLANPADNVLQYMKQMAEKARGNQRATPRR